MGFQHGFNPFANVDLRVPTHQHQTMRELSKSMGGDDPGNVAVDRMPFDRMVDVWLLSVAIGAARGIKVSTGPGGVEVVKFVTGQVLQRDPDVIAFLMNLAVADSENPYIVSDARAMIEIAEKYAAAGIDELADLSKAGASGPTINLLRELTVNYGPKPHIGPIDD